MPKLICLLSGGIDSPVAADIMLKKGFDVVLLHLYTSESKKSLVFVKKIVKQLELNSKKKLELYAGNQAQNQKIFASRCESRLMCILCKRMMYRIAEAFAKKIRAEGILTGENMGQVASQTLKNLSTLSRATKLPIIRPLLGMEKNDIINIAKEIGTYDISISAKSRCEFVPSKPETAASEAEVDVEESTLDMRQMIKDSLGSIERLL
jgi:thiamine biosynthesis protein ThiI